jgi:hypothetical protein
MELTPVVVFVAAIFFLLYQVGYLRGKRGK